MKSLLLLSVNLFIFSGTEVYHPYWWIVQSPLQPFLFSSIFYWKSLSRNWWGNTFWFGEVIHIDTVKLNFRTLDMSSTYAFSMSLDYANVSSFCLLSKFMVFISCLTKNMLVKPSCCTVSLWMNKHSMLCNHNLNSGTSLKLGPAPCLYFAVYACMSIFI